MPGPSVPPEEGLVTSLPDAFEAERDVPCRLTLIYRAEPLAGHHAEDAPILAVKDKEWAAFMDLVTQLDQHHPVTRGLVNFASPQRKVGGDARLA